MKQQLKRLTLPLALLAALSLAGCGGGVGAGAGSPTGGGGGLGGGGGGGGGATGSTSITLNSFTATGTNGATTSPASGKPVTITGSQNGGQFQVNWTSSGGNGGYNGYLFLSAKPGDVNVDSGDAVQIMQVNCGLGEYGSLPDCPANTGTVPCTFDEADMAMVCPNDEGFQQVGTNQFNVGQWLSDHGGLPGSYNLVLQLCTTGFNPSTGQFTDQCSTKTIPVSLN